MELITGFDACARALRRLQNKCAIVCGCTAAGPLMVKLGHKDGGPCPRPGWGMAWALWPPPCPALEHPRGR